MFRKCSNFEPQTTKTMGGLNSNDIISIFLATNLANPTKEQLLEFNPKRAGDSILWGNILERGYPGLVVREGDHYRLHERVVAEGLTEAKEKLDFWQKRVVQLEQP